MTIEPTPRPAHPTDAGKPRVRVIAIVGLGIALTAVGLWLRPWEPRSGAGPAAGAGASGSPSAQKPPEEVAVSGLRLKGRSLASSVHAVGSLLANESVVIAPEVARRITKIHFDDGARVKKGDVLFDLDDADLRAKLSQLAVKRKVLADVEARKKKLLTEGLMSQGEYDDAKGALDLADAEAGPITVELARTKIRAPFDGRLGLRTVSVGAMVSQGQKLVTLEDDSRIKIDFTIPERYARTVKVGATFGFTVEGGSVEGKNEGSVTAIETKVDEGSRSLKLRGVANAHEGLVSGQFVSVELAIASEAGALFVPSEVVVPSLGGHSVFRVKDDTAEVVPVELGIRTEREVQLVKGVAEGDVIIVSNLLRLRPGAKIKLGAVE